MACDLACENVRRGGGPCGAIIVKDGEVIAAAGNTVTLDKDPTAHAEVNAIRRACSSLNDHKLDGCVIYCSSEPCSMCLSAIYCAGLSRIYYSNTAAVIPQNDFDDEFICTEIQKPQLERKIPYIHIKDVAALDKTLY
jgi:tRNA(Arg) A34 adenosine deaminase TadA